MTDSVKKIKIWLVVLIVSSLLGLTGCELLPDTWELPWQQASSATPGQTAVPLPTGVTAEATEVVEEQTPTPAPPPEKLILWLPPELDPNGETAAAAILKDRLNEFAYLNTIEIEVRIKRSLGWWRAFGRAAHNACSCTIHFPGIVVALSRETSPPRQPRMRLFYGK